MRTLKISSTYATTIRMQERMDQRYIINVTRNVMGELEITPTDLEQHPSVRDFSKHVFQSVLHHIQEWNSTTLGKIVAYGLGKGETSKDRPLRTTSLEDAWYGSPLALGVNGGLALEWLAATTIVAAAYDILYVHALVRGIQTQVNAGGGHGVSISELKPPFRFPTSDPEAQYLFQEDEWQRRLERDEWDAEQEKRDRKKRDREASSFS